MFEINDYVIYGATGICKIEDIRDEKFGTRTKQMYYVIKPIYSDSWIIYAPIESGSKRMKKVLSPDEVYSLIKSMPDEEDIWIEEDSRRKEKYNTIIKNGNRENLVKLIKTLYYKREEKIKNGKKIHIIDERFMKDAEKLLYEEFALVLNLDINEVVPMILDELSGKKKTGEIGNEIKFCESIDNRLQHKS